MVALVLDEATEKMAKAVGHARAEFAGVRTGRAAPQLIEKLSVDVYGAEVPLQQVANISVPEARMLVVSPYDKASMASIEKAIRNSDLGLNPSSDGQVIRLNFPPLTAERRRDLVKLVKHMAEEGKVAVRNVRRAARHDLDQLEHDGDLSKDELQRAEKDLDKLTHAQEAEIESALQHKEQELLED
jgi:ribosome recycling factor